ncbi:Myelin-oligodendrocyte glycoprotein, partial [Nibea albiflora]
DESDVVGSHEPVKATVGQDVILPCHVEPPSDVSTLTVVWRQGAKEVQLYRSGADDLNTQDKNFKHRTSLFHEEMSRGNISLKLTKVTELDAGKYSCFVPKLDGQVKRGNVILTVGFHAEPSQLICSHQPIVALAGDDVILPCHLEPPINVRSETVIWTRTDLDPKYIHYHEDGRLNFKNQNPSYRLRTRLFVAELENGNVSMKIFKVKLSDTGEYKCSLPSMQKEASIQLTVAPGAVSGIVIAAVLVVAGLIVWKTCRNAGETMVTASVGEDVILPCKLTHSFNARTLRVEWIHDGGQKTEDVHLYRKGDDDLHDQDKNFKHRTSVFPEEMSRGNISLKLTKVTELDAGKYSCNVKTQNIAEAFTACSVTLAPPESNVEPKWVKHRLTGMDQLICPTSVQATVGESVTLDFHFKSQLDVTSELIEWKFNNSIRVLVFRSRGVSKDQADQFRSRASLLSADDVSKGKLAVKISALTRMDAGMYSCFVGRGGTKRSCSVELIIPSSEERVKPEIAIVVKFLVCVVSLSAVIVLIKTWSKFL